MCALRYVLTPLGVVFFARLPPPVREPVKGGGSMCNLIKKSKFEFLGLKKLKDYQNT